MTGRTLRPHLGRAKILFAPAGDRRPPAPRAVTGRRSARPTALPWWMVAVLAWAGAIVAGCDDRTERRAERARVRVLLVGRAERDATWPILREAAADYEAANRYSCALTCRATPVVSPSAQRELLDSCTPEEVHALCMWPADPDALRSTVSRVANRGIPVILLGRDMRDSGRAAFCGPNERALGEALGEAIAASVAAGREGIGVIYAEPQAPDVSARLAGFHAAIDRHPVRVLREVDLSGPGTVAASLLRREIEKYPRMGGWALLDDRALAGVPADVGVVPAGAALAICSADVGQLERIRRGRASAVVLFDFRAMVEQALSAAVSYGRGTRPRLSVYHADPLVVTSANLAEMERRLFGPAN